MEEEEDDHDHDPDHDPDHEGEQREPQKKDWDWHDEEYFDGGLDRGGFNDDDDNDAGAHYESDVNESYRSDNDGQGKATTYYIPHVSGH